MAPLNNWLPSTIAKARRIVEDSDRKARTDTAFVGLIEHVHHLLCSNAHSAGPPKVERLVTDDRVLLSIEWFDSESNWHLYFGIQRILGEKPVVVLDFFGAVGKPGSYDLRSPSDVDIRKALHDYFQGWKKA